MINSQSAIGLLAPTSVRTAAAVACLCFVATGCNHLDELQNDGLAQCELFLKSSLRTPSSYKRVSFGIVDLPVKKSVLASSLGNGSAFETVAELAPNPGVRGIAIDFNAENEFGALVRHKSACYFPLSDVKIGKRALDWEQLAESSARITELQTITGVKRDHEICCLAPEFDLSKLHDNEAIN